MTKQQRHNQLVRRCSLVAATALMSAFVLGMQFSKPVSAKEISYEKIYTNYTVQRGDTLTSIVKKYAVYAVKSEDYYIKEILFLNNMSDPDDIKAGENIVIPAYIIANVETE